MTYDEHGSWGEPGPVASYPWVESVIKYALTTMPSSKILLGLPAYGYDWNTTTNTGNKAVTWKSIPNLISTTGAVAQWDSVAQSPYFYYTDSTGNNHTVWYENTQSITAKTKLVNTYNLGGIGMWRMGLEDVNFWTAVKSGLGQ
jgi:spore germination protein YaaH